MTELSVSVAMCAYGSARFVRAQLDSLAQQTHQPDELVVCDDASSDTTYDIIAAFARSAPFEVRLFREYSNIGRVANFEKAISHCTKDILFLSDADDVWHERKIQRMLQAFQCAPTVAGVFCDAEVVDAALRPLGYSHSELRKFTPAIQTRLRNGEAYDALLRGQIVQGAALAFKASYRPLLLPLSRCWGHDSWIAILLGAVGTLVFVDEKLMSHRQHGGNLIGAIQAKPKRLERWAKKLCEPRQHYRRALAAVTYFSKQMDDLHRRLACWPESACSQKFREAIGRRRMKLQRRKRAVELILSVLDNFHLQHDPTTEELPPPR